MSDSTKTSLADKAAKTAAIVAGIAAGAAVIPQDELAKEGLPAFWEAIKGIAASGWESAKNGIKELRPFAFRCWTKLVSVLKWWALLSAALVIIGIEVTSRTGSNVGHVLVAAGTISFSGLGILLFTLTDGIAAILYLKLKVVGSVFGKVTSLVGVHLPETLDEEDLKRFRDKIRLVLAGTVVMCFSLLFTMLFPAYSTLGWTMCFWAMVAVAVTAAIYLDLQMGKAVRVVFFITIGLIAATFVVFILDRLSGGALKFGAFRAWLLRVNGSEILMAILALIPLALLLMSAFAKDKDRKLAYRMSAKYVGIGSAALLAFLLYKGTISWKSASGHDSPKMLQEASDAVEKTSFGDLKPSKSAPQGTNAKGTYLQPPTGNPGPSDDPAPRASTPRAKKQPLPPLKAKTYEDAASAIDDLESLL